LGGTWLDNDTGRLLRPEPTAYAEARSAYQAAAGLKVSAWDRFLVEPSWTGAAEVADEVWDWTAEKLSNAWEEVKSWIDRNAKAIVGVTVAVVGAAIGSVGGPAGMMVGAAWAYGLYTGAVSAAERIAAGQSAWQVVKGALGDATGWSQVHAGYYNEDFATGKYLNMTLSQRWLTGIAGGMQMAMMALPVAKGAIALARSPRVRSAFSRLSAETRSLYLDEYGSIPGRRGIMPSQTANNGIGVGSGNAYSVAFQTKLAKPALPIGTRAAHNQAANKALLEAMDNDTVFAAQMRKMIPGVDEVRGPLGGVSYKAPKDWTWNHAVDHPGVMQLVPRVQHTSGSPTWWLMHDYPSGTGGFAQWGSQY
ncbi:MAG TPA: HNH endonuclease, partial [Candidatus Hydrogenedentes bacterium]|nr:HNH endonuclease [Candidatus Hydrogenedentota bacterium]